MFFLGFFCLFVFNSDGAIQRRYYRFEGYVRMLKIEPESSKTCPPPPPGSPYCTCSVSVPLFQQYLKGFPLVCSIRASKKLKGSALLTGTEMLVTSPPLGYFPLRTLSQFTVLAALSIFPRLFLPLPSPSV